MELRIFSELIRYKEKVMKSLIKTCSVKHKRITSLTKSTICTTVILILAFTANSFAVPSFTLDADTPATGSLLISQPLVTSYGNITFIGELNPANWDPDFIAAGASGDAFDILNPDASANAQTAELLFGFDVLSLMFSYGGNAGNITIEARDKDGGVVDSFYQADTMDGQPAGPITLSGTGIRSLYWTDTVEDMSYAALDNIEVTASAVIPSPSAAILTGIGVSFVGWLRKRKIV